MLLPRPPIPPLPSRRGLLVVFPEFIGLLVDPCGVAPRPVALAPVVGLRLGLRLGGVDMTASRVVAVGVGRRALGSLGDTVRESGLGIIMISEEAEAEAEAEGEGEGEGEAGDSTPLL